MQNIGERLEEARKQKGISIREAAEATKVRSDYLHRFESSQFDINLPDIYVRGFLRSYATYLGLPADKIVADYNALGHGKPKQTRSANREIYGRIDIAPPTEKASSRTSDDGSPGDGDDAEREASSFGSVRGLPVIDRNLLIKGGIVVGAAVVGIILIFSIVKIFSGGDDTVATGTTTGDQIATVNEDVAIIHALDTVRVKVVAEGTNQELYQGTIVRGDSRSFPWEGQLLVTASALENIEIEMDGRRYPTNETGRNRIRIPSPAALRGE